MESQKNQLPTPEEFKRLPRTESGFVKAECNEVSLGDRVRVTTVSEEYTVSITEIGKCWDAFTFEPVVAVVGRCTEGKVGLWKLQDPKTFDGEYTNLYTGKKIKEFTFKEKDLWTDREFLYTTAAAAMS